MGHEVVLITLIRAIVVFCGTDNIVRNVLHIHAKCEEYFA